MRLSPLPDKVDMDLDDTTSRTNDVVVVHQKGQLQQNYISKESNKVVHTTIQVNQDRNQHILPIENLSHKNKCQEDDGPDNMVDTDLYIS